ncbi:MAG TPA: ABC transporter permease subunit [Acidimicrobiia bacterium]|nr:ABC transporter permease subunit [Acidimicrobiia bacterium]
MADTRPRTDPDPDQQELGQEEAHIGSTLPPDESRPPRRRHPLFIILAAVIGIVVYALAFQQTEVRLDEITSETRQQSLARILRALAQPNLVTYDTEPSTTEIELGLPCGPSGLATSPAFTATPNCGDPGDVITVTGTGFEPREFVSIVFVPDTEFNITLRLAGVNAEADGSFETQITLPERTSEQPQALRAVTEEPIGSWRNRVEVFNDANENGVEDDPVLPEDGAYSLTIAASPDVPAVALLNAANEVTRFVTTGEAFEAVEGQARGETAIPLTEVEEDSTGLNVTSIDASNGEIAVDLAGPAGFDMSNWRLVTYDGATGTVGPSAYISDTIQLSPRISETAIITLDKILETVFLALVATTAGLFLAIPLSFVAARNIMRDISITVTNFVLVLIAMPLGAVAGVTAARLARTVVGPLGDNVFALLGGLVVAVAAAVFLVRRAVPPVEDEIPTRTDRIRRGSLLLLAAVVGLVGILLLSLLFQELGAAMLSSLGALGFIGAFFTSVGEILDVALILIAALGTAGVFAHLASKLGYAIRNRAPRPVVRTVNLVLAAVAGAMWAVLIGQVVDWFYQIGSTRATVIIPAIVGAILGVLIALRGMHKGEVEIGLSIYYAARTVFNTLRSIEPLVMAIVFVVWVGAGPFAGSLALALHTAAALAKLYSEQVESISPGPIEAVRATGANRLQTIVYSVVPQIVPPYISFTMYRWDINVRMSTILGFVGGGGIGSILQQNINLLQYRDAAVQMLAIAIVVATMDWASSRMREHFV